MNILFVLVPVALMLAALGVAGFIWSVRSGQFDDLETPGMRVLFGEERVSDDDPDATTENARTTTSGKAEPPDSTG